MGNEIFKIYVIGLDKSSDRFKAFLENNSHLQAEFYEGVKGTEISEEEADYNHMLQTLAGDYIDGIPGCPSIGIKTAEKILAPHKGNKEAMWQAIVRRYKMNNLDEKHALTQARLTRIIRNEDFNYERKRPILWQSPKQKTS